MPNHSGIYLGLSVGMYALSTISAVKAALDLNGKPVKENLRVFIPAGILFLSGTGLVLAVHLKNERDYAVVTQAYGLTRTALEQLQEVLPAKVLRTAQGQLHEETAQRLEIPPNQLVLSGSQTYAVCHTTGQTTITTVERIRQAEQELNYSVINHGMATMGDYCYALGLEPIKNAGQLGWTSGPITFTLSAKLKNGITPVVVIDVSPLPQPL